MSHTFLAAVDWPKLASKAVAVPIKPCKHMQIDTDLTNFSSQFTTMKLSSADSSANAGAGPGAGVSGSGGSSNDKSSSGGSGGKSGEEGSPGSRKEFKRGLSDEGKKLYIDGKKLVITGTHYAQTMM
jgi:hypothetical protein